MALIKCPECDRDISDKASACPNCGYPIAKYLNNNEDKPDFNAKTSENSTRSDAEDNGINEGWIDVALFAEDEPYETKESDVGSEMLRRPVNEKDDQESVIVSDNDSSTIPSPEGAPIEGIPIPKNHLKADISLEENAFAQEEEEDNSSESSSTHPQDTTPQAKKRIANLSTIIPDHDMRKQLLIFLSVVVGTIIFFIVLVNLPNLFHTHSWKAATCTTPKTCTECGQTEGAALGHSAGEWEKEPVDAINATQDTVKRCTRCQSIIDSKSEKVTSFVNGNKFIFTPNEFVKRFDASLDSIGYLTAAIGTSSDGLLGIIIESSSGSRVGTGIFSSTGDDTLRSTDKYSSSVIGNIVIMADGTDEAAELMISLMMACDPTLDIEGAKSLCRKMLEGAKSVSGSTTHNGITYSMLGSGSTYAIGARTY